MTTRKKYREPKSVGEPVYRADSFQNLITGLNVPGQDKRRAASFVPRRMSESEAEELWIGDDVIERIVETIPLVTLRNGFTVQVADEAESTTKTEEPLEDFGDDGEKGARIDRKLKKIRKKHARARMDADDAQQMQREMAKKLAGLQAVKHFITAMQYARAYGGSAIWISSDEIGSSFKDQKRLERRLEPEKLKDIRALIVLRPRECYPCRWYSTDQQDPKYGSPSHYMISRDTMGGGAASTPVIVHESRLLRFYGAITSRQQMARNNGWGDSVLIRCLEVIADYQATYQAAAYLVQDFAQAVQKVAGLAELVASDDLETIQQRAQMIAQCRSVARTVLIDSEEEYTREQTALTGLPETMDRINGRVASTAKMPISLLFGESPGGLNATGETNARWFYDDVKNRRELDLRPPLELLVRLLWLCTDGPSAGEEPGSWTLEFGPMWEPTEKELAERNKTQAESDGIYIDKGVLTPEEVADSRFGTGKWNQNTRLDQKTRALVKEVHEMVVDEQVGEGKIPNASPTNAAAQQNAVDLAASKPANEDDEEKKAEAK